MAPELDACSPADISATIVHLLGIKPTQEIRTQTGRPVQLFREGNVIDALVG
jgi:hypothetical protein